MYESVRECKRMYERVRKDTKVNECNKVSEIVREWTEVFVSVRECTRELFPPELIIMRPTNRTTDNVALEHIAESSSKTFESHKKYSSVTLHLSSGSLYLIQDGRERLAGAGVVGVHHGSLLWIRRQKGMAMKYTAGYRVESFFDGSNRSHEGKRGHSPSCSGCGKREAHQNWSMMITEKSAPVTGATLRTTGPVLADSR